MSRASLLVALAVLGGVAAPAAADKHAAEKYFRAGERAYRAQNFEAAAQNFEEAYKELPLPEIAFSAAQAYRREYRVDQKPTDVARALTLYRIYLAAVKQGGRVRDAADAIGELQPEYDRLASSGKLGAAAAAALTRLGAGVAFADVSERDPMKEIEDRAATPQTAVTAQIDGHEVPANELVPVEPGPHVIHVSAAGYQSAERKVTAASGASEMIDFELKPEPAQLTVITERGARLSVDGRQVATAPAGALRLDPGRHLLRIAHDGRELAGRDLDVTRGQLLTVTMPLQTTRRRRLVPWVAGGAGVLALAATGATVAALHFDHSATHDLTLLGQGDQRPAVLDDYTSSHAWRDRMVDTIWITGAAAVAIGATAAWLYYFDTPPSEGVQVAPIATVTAAGAAISGHF